MKKVLIITLFAAVAWCVGTTIAAAQTNVDHGTVTINVHVSSYARLELNGANPGNVTVDFLDADPQTVPSITGAPAVAVSARVRTTPAGAVTLTMVATNLTDGTSTIPLANITWAANNDLLGGALNTAAVTIGNWSGPGVRTGTQTFVLANSWSYATADYTSTVTYTLTAA